MARYGVERRCPFMDLDIIDFALRIPGRAPTHGLRDKHLLRLVGEGMAPPTVLNRISKTGYIAAFKATAHKVIAESNMTSWNLVEQGVVSPAWMRRVDQAPDHDDATLFNVMHLSVAEVYIARMTCTS